LPNGKASAIVEVQVSNTALLIIAGIFVVLSGVLVAAEAALARVSKVSIEQLKRDGNRRSGRLLDMLDDRAKHVNSLLFAHLTLSTISVILVTTSFLEIFNDNSVALLASSVVMVLIGYVILGVAPQTLGRQRADTIAMATARLTKFVTLFLSPLTQLFILLGNAITPGKGYREGPFSTQAELRELVDLAGADSLIEDDERQMIHSVFELGDTFAKEVMVPRTDMVSIDRDSTLRDAMSLGLRSGFSRIPVIGDNSDDVVGVINLKDVVRRTFANREAETTERVDSLMRAPYFVPDSKPADILLREMQAARVHMAIVIDEYGGTAGLVTIEDVLEEIVGEITDEYDTGAPEVAELGEGAYRVLARMHLEDLADLIGIELDSEEEGVDTVLGLVAKRLGRVPIAGASVEIDGWTLTAEQGAGRRNRIGTVLASRRVPQES
jgi:CBS domain containing-hemolysin-like protein